MKYPLNAMFFSCVILVTGLFSMDLYNPALPAITQAFRSSQSLIRNVVVAYLFGVAISQLFYGPMSDRKGRKPIIAFGLSLCLIGNVLSALSHSGLFLLIARFITGLGAGACPVVSRSIIRDSFEDKSQLTKGFSIFAMSSTLSPAFAPIIGGFIQAYINWQATFIFLSVLSLAVTISIIFSFKETAKKTTNSSMSLIISYKHVLMNFQFLSHAIMSALVFTLSIGYYTISPFIYQHDLGFSASENGLFYVVYALGIFLGSTIANKLTTKIQPEKSLWLGICLMLFICIFMVFINLVGYFNVYTVIIPTFVLAISCGMTAPILIALSILSFSKAAGVASAMQGTIKMLGTGIVLALFGFVHFKSQLPMSSFFLIITAFVLILNILNRLRINNEN